MAKSKEEKAKDSELRMMGVIPKITNFELSSAKKLRLAWFWIPIMSKCILVFSSLSILFCILSIGSIFLRPEAMPFVSFYDGHIECAESFDSHGKKRILTASEQAMCERFKPFKNKDE